MKNNETLINEFLENKNPSEEIKNLLNELKTFKSFMLDDFGFNRHVLDDDYYNSDDYCPEDLNKQEKFRIAYLTQLIKTKTIEQKLNYVEKEIEASKERFKERLKSDIKYKKQLEDELHIEDMVMGCFNGNAKLDFGFAICRMLHKSGFDEDTLYRIKILVERGGDINFVYYQLEPEGETCLDMALRRIDIYVALDKRNKPNKKENKLIQELILLGAKTKKELDKEKSIA